MVTGQVEVHTVLISKAVGSCAGAAHVADQFVPACGEGAPCGLDGAQVLFEGTVGFGTMDPGQVEASSVGANLELAGDLVVRAMVSAPGQVVPRLEEGPPMIGEVAPACEDVQGQVACRQGQN